MHKGALTEDSVKMILRAGPNANAREFAILLGVATETVRRVIRRETWTWVRLTPTLTQETEIAAMAERMLKLQAGIADSKRPGEAAEELLREIPAGPMRTPVTGLEVSEGVAEKMRDLLGK